MKYIQFEGKNYFDDRMIIFDISFGTVSNFDFSEKKEVWQVIIRKNSPDYPGYSPTHFFEFETKEEAFEFYKKELPKTPLISMMGKPLEPILDYESYVEFLKNKGIDATPFSNQT